MSALGEECEKVFGGRKVDACTLLRERMNGPAEKELNAWGRANEWITSR